jgi:hypothetical protein
MVTNTMGIHKIDGFGSSKDRFKKEIRKDL